MGWPPCRRAALPKSNLMSDRPAEDQRRRCGIALPFAQRLGDRPAEEPLDEVTA